MTRFGGFAGEQEAVSTVNSILLYLQLAKPRIITLLDFVAATSFLAGNYLGGVSGRPIGGIVELLVAGTLASAAAGSFNSYFDRDLDALMGRTSTRPIPAGRISASRGLVFSILLSAVAFAYSGLVLRPLAAAFIVLGFVTYVFIYTIWLKRRSSWNIVIGGFAGSCASLAGWSEATGTLALPAVIMALIIFLWTPSHFWSLALRVTKDYGAVGVPMLPQVVGAPAASKIIVVNTLILIGFSTALFLWGGLGMIYLVTSLGLGALLLAFNLRTMMEPSGERGFAAFKISSPYLAVLFTVIVLDAALRI